MPFVNDVLKYRSLSIVGLEKNTGKTVCLNYLLSRLENLGVFTRITSIGVDGELTDSVFATEKPEIVLYPGMQFVTSEQHYCRRRLVSMLIAADERRTALGQIVTAEALTRGKVLLSGAATTALLRQQIDDAALQGVRLMVVDGALSRLSLASPTVTDAMILATGAAVSPNLQQLVSKTRFVFRLINLPEVEEPLKERLGNIASGLWTLDADGMPCDTGIRSSFLLGQQLEKILRHGGRLFVSGAVSDRLLKQLALHPKSGETELIVRDFTKLFVTPEVWAEYGRRGGRVAVLQRTHLIAVCLNPTSPQGYRLNSREACAALSDALATPVYDVMQI